MEEHTGTKWDRNWTIFKFLIGTVLLTIIPIILNYQITRREILIKEQEQVLKEQELFSQFLKEAVNDDHARRVRFAEYFRTITRSKEIKAVWEEYYRRVKDEYDRFLQAQENKERQVKSLENLRYKNFYYEIDTQFLSKLQEMKFPENVLDKLKILENEKFDSEKDLMDTVETLAKNENFTNFIPIIKTQVKNTFHQRKKHLEEIDRKIANLKIQLSRYESEATSQPAAAEVVSSKNIMNESELSGSNMSGLNLSDLSINRSNLTRANLSQANLNNTRIEYSILKNTNLTSADLRSASLTGSDLGESDLRGALLEGAILKNTRMTGCDLRGVKGLTCEQLKEAIDWENTIRDEDIACGSPSL